MNSTRTAASPPKVPPAAVRVWRATAVTVIAAGTVAGLVWAAGSSRGSDLGAANGTDPGAATATDPSAAPGTLPALHASAALLMDADPLTDATATGMPAVIGTGVPPLPRRLPAGLRADLRELRSMEPGRRSEEAARIWRYALAGEYGRRVRVRAAEAQAVYHALPGELRADIEELRTLNGEEHRKERQEIREKALDGAYGDQVRRWAEDRLELWWRNRARTTR
ncbi:hypothetical protein ACHBTE_34830 [Streptomyces sp. M41]|uniref:hypothetical protein n=1 Tax=Streptomyces sp. M41 TaxID=3059412 RepID=UPI00374D9EFB